MAGPVPTYSTTQTATQTAFTVPFGLLSLVTTKMAAAVAAGEFNTTVDCSLFVTEDISNLRIYLDSQGYTVEFAKGSNEKSLLIDWGKFLDIPDSEVTVDQGTGGSSPWLVKEAQATDGTVSTVIVTTSSTLLLAANPARKGVVIQCKDTPLYVITSSASASTSNYSYYVLKLNALELKDTYIGPISAVVATGTASVQVTEQV